MDFSAILPQPYFQNNIFTSIRPENELVVDAPRKVELLDIYITTFPRHCNEDLKTADYVFKYFEGPKVDFMLNQDHINILSNELFGHTKPLDNEEQTHLNNAYARTMKTTPTRANRL